MPETSGRRTSTARRKARFTLSPEERAERIAVAREQLLGGIDKLMTADGWEQLITSRAWLRRYSLNNVIMILAQCPEATDVRPKSEWAQRGYGLMRKGTHKINIWKPRFQRLDKDTTGATAESAPHADGDQTARALSGFILVPVVDVSQLQGNPEAHRPALPRPIELSGDAPTGLWDGIAAQITANGYSLERGDCGTAYGRTVWADRRVVVRADIEPAQAAKTATHELAHILCDHDTRTTITRNVREVEAESVACIVAAACGLDTLSYSVPYVASWAADRDTARGSAGRVLAVADTILAQLDHAPDLPVAHERLHAAAV
jgi:hypothetical protein